MDDNMIQDDKISRMIRILKANFELKELIHLTKYGGEWFNGRIFEMGSDFLLLHDRVRGVVSIYYVEVDSVVKYEPPVRGCSK